jgi:hypothetical protein
MESKVRKAKSLNRTMTIKPAPGPSPSISNPHNPARTTRDSSGSLCLPGSPLLLLSLERAYLGKRILDCLMLPIVRSEKISQLLNPVEHFVSGIIEASGHPGSVEFE